MHSAIYTGWLDHRRRVPRRHAFRQRLFMVYLDLAELDRVFAGRWLWSCRRPALARFDRRDHFGDAGTPLDESVRRLVAERTGRRPDGPIRLLTHLRYFGYVFNPVSFYYCFAADSDRLEAVVAEVTNTPWGERHCYVLPGPGAGATSAHAAPCPHGAALKSTTQKAMHVSPFHAMDLRYDWRIAIPEERLRVHMGLRPQDDPQGDPIFSAALSLVRRPITASRLAATLACFPFMTAQVIAGIHWQALRLWLKGVPVVDHPASTPTPSDDSKELA